MRYRIENKTLIIEGNFNAVSSGLIGGWRNVGWIFNHTVPENFDSLDPFKYIRSVAERFSMDSYFGLLTSVPMEKLAVVRKYDVTAFVTAGVKNPGKPIGTINTILIIDAHPSDGAMINAVITATEAKIAALIELGHNFTGTNTDAVVVARTSGKYYEYAGPASELGEKIWDAVKKAVTESLSKW